MRIRTVIGIVGAAGLAVALPLLAAERLAVKTGQWENSATMSLKLNLPKEQLDRMPPEMLKQMGVGTPLTMTEKSCLTDKDLEGKAFADSMNQAGQDCQTTQVVDTAKRKEWTFQCKSPGGAATGRMVVEVVSDTQVRGTMEMRAPQANMDMKFDAKWLAASCPATTR